MRMSGKNPVLERLKNNPRSIKRIIIQDGHPEASYIYQKAKKWGIPIVSVPGSKILKLARNVNSQGLLIEVEDFSYQPIEDLLEGIKQGGHGVFFLDGINDPQNLGSLIRSLACLGHFGIVIPTHNAVAITEAVLRVASGGDNFVRVALVANLGHAIAKAKSAGYWMAGTVVESGEDVRSLSFPFPVGIVIGSEQKGVRDVLLKQVDVRITIPMAQPRLSLNVAQATTLLAYELVRSHIKTSPDK